ncbi:MAG: hypothetical protein ACI9GW_003187 [Halieaceae bacterium]
MEGNRILKVAALLFTLVLAACKHPLAIDGEGDIVDQNESGFGCTLEQFRDGDLVCIENDITTDYFVNYAAVPRSGWTFVRWDGACGHLSEGNNCRFDVAAVLTTFWDGQFSAFPIDPLTAVFEQEQGDPSEAYFLENIAGPVLTPPGCLNCHIAGGLSGHTRLVFTEALVAGADATNLQVFKDFVATVPNGAALILLKMKGGSGHEGGVIFNASTTQYAAMSEFLDLL